MQRQVLLLLATHRLQPSMRWHSLQIQVELVVSYLRSGSRWRKINCDWNCLEHVMLTHTLYRYSHNPITSFASMLQRRLPQRPLQPKILLLRPLMSEFLMADLTVFGKFWAKNTVIEICVQIFGPGTQNYLFRFPSSKRIVQVLLQPGHIPLH